MPDAGVRLWNECSFLVLDRPGYEIPEHLPANFIELTPLAGSTIEVLRDEKAEPVSVQELLRCRCGGAALVVVAVLSMAIHLSLRRAGVA